MSEENDDEYKPEKDAQKRIIEKREENDEYKSEKKAQKKIRVPAAEEKEKHKCSV